MTVFFASRQGWEVATCFLAAAFGTPNPSKCQLFGHPLNTVACQDDTRNAIVSSWKRWIQGCGSLSWFSQMFDKSYSSSHSHFQVISSVVGWHCRDMGYGLLRLFAFRCLAPILGERDHDFVATKPKWMISNDFDSLKRGPSFVGPQVPFSDPEQFINCSLGCFFLRMVFESYNPNVTLGTCTSASWAGSFFVVESFSPGWTDCLRHALWPWCGPQPLVEISANGPLGSFGCIYILYMILWCISYNVIYIYISSKEV